MSSISTAAAAPLSPYPEFASTLALAFALPPASLGTAGPLASLFVPRTDRPPKRLHSQAFAPVSPNDHNDPEAPTAKRLRPGASTVGDGARHLFSHTPPRDVRAMLDTSGAGGVLETVLPASCTQALFSLHYRRHGDRLCLFEVRLCVLRSGDTELAVHMSRLPGGARRLTPALAEALLNGSASADADPGPELCAVSLEEAKHNLRVLGEAASARAGGPLLWLPHDGHAHSHPTLPVYLADDGQVSAVSALVAQLLRALPLRFAWPRLRLSLLDGCGAPAPRRPGPPEEAMVRWAAVLVASGAAETPRRKLWLSASMQRATTGFVALCRTMLDACPTHGQHSEHKWVVVLRITQRLAEAGPSDPLVVWLSDATQRGLWGGVEVLVECWSRKQWSGVPEQRQAAAALLRRLAPGGLRVCLSLRAHKGWLPEALDAPLQAALAERPHSLKVVAGRHRLVVPPGIRTRDVERLVEGASSFVHSAVRTVHARWAQESTRDVCVSVVWPGAPITYHNDHDAGLPGTPGRLLMDGEAATWVSPGQPALRAAGRTGLDGRPELRAKMHRKLLLHGRSMGADMGCLWGAPLAAAVSES